METGKSTLAFGAEIQAAHNARVLSSELVPEETKMHLAEVVCAGETEVVRDEETENTENIADILNGDAGTRIDHLQSINKKREAITVEAALQKSLVTSQPWLGFMQRNRLIG